MSELSFRCSSCNKLLRTRDPQMAGKTVRCPNCGVACTVPGTVQAPQPAKQPPRSRERPATEKVERRGAGPDQAPPPAKKRARAEDGPRAVPESSGKRAQGRGKGKKQGGPPVVAIVATLVALGFVGLAGAARYASIFTDPPRLAIARTVQPPDQPPDRPDGPLPPLPKDKDQGPGKDKEEKPKDKGPTLDADIAAQVEKLRAPEEATRATAADALGGMGAKALPALRPLIAALADKGPAVRQKAAGALRAIGDRPPSVLLDFTASWCPPCQRMKPVTAKLIKEGLPLWEIDTDKHPDLSDRFDVRYIPTFVVVKDGKATTRDTGELSEDYLRSLMKGMPRTADAPLPSDLKGPASEARWVALLLSLMEEDAWVHFQAYRDIQKHGPRAVPVLTEVIGGRYPDLLQGSATWALGVAVAGQKASPEVTALLKGILARPDGPVDLRGHAAVLAHDQKVEDDQVVPALTAALKGGAHYPLRTNAANRLGELQRPESVPPLIDALKDKNYGPYQAAVVALGKFGGRAGAAVPALLAQYDKEKHGPTRDTIRQACQQIVPSAKEAGAALAQALKEGSEPVRLLALDLLGSLNDPRAGEDSLVPLLESESPALRARAAIALHQMGQDVPAATKALVATLKEERENYEATNILRQTSRRSAPLLVDCVTGPGRTPRERRRAARILAATRGMKSILPALEKGLEGKDEQARLCSALVLARVAPANEAVVPPLVAGLESGDREVQRECAQALASTRQKAAAKALLAALERLDKGGEDAEDSRREVASALSSFELSEGEIDSVIALLKKPNSRSAAALVLGRAGEKSPKAAPALIEAFQKANERDRQEVGEALVEIGKPAVAGLVKLFEDAKASEPVRLEALRALGQMGDQAQDARPALAKHLKDASKQVRWRVAMALAHPKAGDDLVPLLLEALEDKQAVFEAQSALGRLGPRPAAVGPLCEMLKSSDQNSRSMAVRLLPEVGRDSDRAMSALLALLHSKEGPGVRQSVAYSLSRFGEKVVPGLIEALSDPVMSRPDVVRALEQLGPSARAASPPLAKLLLDKDRTVAAQAAIALARVDPKRGEAVPVLLEAARSKDRPLRDSALLALPAFGPQARPAVPLLVEALRSTETRGTALRALAAIGPDAAKAVEPITHLLATREKTFAANTLGAIGPAAAPAVPRLIGMLGNEQTVYAAAAALGKIGGPAREAVPVLVKMLADEGLRLRACQALAFVGKLAPDEAIPPLSKLAADADVELRSQAIRALGALQSTKAVPPLLKALEDADLRARVDAAHALGQLGPHAAEAVPALRGLLGGKDVALRRAAVVALGGLGDAAEPAVPALLASLDDPETRLTAIHALGRIGAKAEAAIPRLVKLLDDGNSRFAAVRALGQFGPRAKEALPRLRTLLKEGTGPLLVEIRRSLEMIEGAGREGAD